MADTIINNETSDHQNVDTINSNITTTTATATSAAVAAAATTSTKHPLQDVDLNSESNIQSASAATQNTKENWVKFDDEVNEIHENNLKNNSKSSSTNNNNKNNSNNINSGSSDNNNRATLNVTTTISSNENRLSPILLPPPTSGKSTTSTRPRTPTESKQSQQQQQTAKQISLNATPVQHSTPKIPDVAPAVLTTESTHVNLNASGRSQQQQQQQQQQTNQQHQKLKVTPSNVTSLSNNHHHQQLNNNNNNNNNNSVSSSGGGGSAIQKAVGGSNNVSIPIESASQMRTIELSTGRVREGFANGDVIVTLLPANTKWPWITPAIFRPELVPEELMAQGLTLTVEEYVNAMETLVNDYRFTLYNICYKRILVCWILLAFSVLLVLLFSGLQGAALFALGVGWLFLNAAAIFMCMWVKLRLSRGLEKCLARVNKLLMKHKILLILDDRGRISCHKVNLCFLYFDAAQCVGYLNEFLEHTEQNGGETIKAGWERKLDIDVNDIVIQGSNPVRLSRRQALAQELFLTYLQRWGKDFLRRRLDWTVQEAGVHETPRHLQSSICPCQYEEEVLRNKIKIQLKGRQCCGINCIGCWL